MEVWRDIKIIQNGKEYDFTGCYQISNEGLVKSLDRYVNASLKHQNKVLKKGKILIPRFDKDDYLLVNLFKNGKGKTFKISRLVANAFIPNHNNYNEVNHNDGNKQNNFSENLEWCDRSQNNKHAWNTGLKKATPKMQKVARINGATTRKKIKQYDRCGKFIREWESQKEASRQLNISQGSISSCCKYKAPTAGGYIWRYKED